MQLKKRFAIILMSSMVSCQTINITEKKYKCASLDWFEIGRSDGVRGENSLGWEEREKTCESFSDLNHESYVNGWYAGVNEFCSTGHGFAYGKTGNEYNNVCPTEKETEFLDAYRKGTKIYRYESDNKAFAEELQNLASQASGSEPEKIPVLLKRITELETKMEFNRALISEINREMDESPSKNL